MYLYHDLYKQVRDRTLYVVSLASAAGGSKEADIADDPARHSILQAIEGTVAQWIGGRRQRDVNLTVRNASDIIAPMREDPKVPFFIDRGLTRP